MKKIVVILLLVLPFILIYSISFTGKILSEYTHIYVESLTLIDEEKNELPQGHVITLSKGETYPLQVKILPELASNQAFSVSNSNKEVCQIDTETNVITALEYGVSDIVLTSKDRPITYSFHVRVFDAEIQAIEVDKTEITLEKGKTEAIHVNIIPSTTLPQFRNLIYTSNDDSVAKINANGVITAIGEGETIIVISSDYKPEVYATIKITVFEVDEPIISFNTNTGGILHKIKLSDGGLDLRALTVINVEGYTDLQYTVTKKPAALDETQIGEGVVTFLEEGVYTIEASILYQGKIEKATIRVLVENN